MQFKKVFFLYYNIKFADCQDNLHMGQLYEHMDVGGGSFRDCGWGVERLLERAKIWHMWEGTGIRLHSLAHSPLEIFGIRESLNRTKIAFSHCENC